MQQDGTTELEPVPADAANEPLYPMPHADEVDDQPAVAAQSTPARLSTPPSTRRSSGRASLASSLPYVPRHPYDTRLAVKARGKHRSSIIRYVGGVNEDAELENLPPDSPLIPLPATPLWADIRSPMRTPSPITPIRESPYFITQPDTPASPRRDLFPPTPAVTYTFPAQTPAGVLSAPMPEGSPATPASGRRLSLSLGSLSFGAKFRADHPRFYQGLQWALFALWAAFIAVLLCVVAFKAGAAVSRSWHSAKPKQPDVVAPPVVLPPGVVSEKPISGTEPAPEPQDHEHDHDHGHEHEHNHDLEPEPAHDHDHDHDHDHEHAPPVPVDVAAPPAVVVPTLSADELLAQARTEWQRDLRRVDKELAALRTDGRSHADTLGSQATALRAHGEAAATQAARLAGLEARVGSAEARLDAVGGRLDGLAASGAAQQGRLDALDAAGATHGGRLSELERALEALQRDLVLHRGAEHGALAKDVDALLGARLAQSEDAARRAAAEAVAELGRAMDAKLAAEQAAWRAALGALGEGLGARVDGVAADVAAAGLSQAELRAVLAGAVRGADLPKAVAELVADDFAKLRTEIAAVRRAAAAAAEAKPAAAAPAPAAAPALQADEFRAELADWLRDQVASGSGWVAAMQERLAAHVGAALEASGATLLGPRLDALNASLAEWLRREHNVTLTWMGAVDQVLGNLSQDAARAQARLDLDAVTLAKHETLVQSVLKQLTEILANLTQPGARRAPAAEPTAAPAAAAAAPSAVEREALLREVREMMTQFFVANLSAAAVAHQYDAVGLPDLALASAGAVVKATTPPYVPRGRGTGALSRMLLGLFGNPHLNSPDVMLTPGTVPGQCYALAGDHARVVVQLAVPTQHVWAMTLDHVPRAVALDISSAPREFSLWCTVPYPAPAPGEPVPDEFLLVKGTYDALSVHGAQTFYVAKADAETQPACAAVRLEVHSNYGNPNYTCIYRLRVHPRPTSSWGEVAPDAA